jgi:small-conductance mechanosensitive channel/CRP-like cAMP-binding protein
MNYTFLLAAEIIRFGNLKNWNNLLYIGTSLLVFLGLYVVLIMSYNVLAFFSEKALETGKKVHLQGLGFIFFFSLWWLLLDLPAFTYQASLVTISMSGLVFFACLLLFDIIGNFTFEIYLPREKINVPHIIVNFIRGLYVIGIVLAVMAFVFHMDVRPFLTGSAILTAVIGLALQDTIGNLISGLALHISRPFDIGHWLKVGEVEGVVTKIDWRATTIRTRSEDYITIPNSQLTKVDLINLSMPTTLHGIWVEVGTRYEHPPNKVIQVLEQTVASVEGISREKLPEVYLMKYNNFSIDYRLRFFLDEYERAPVITSKLMERIWYNFNRNNIEIPFPIQDVYIKEPKKSAIKPEDLVILLSSIDFLQDLNYEEVCDVANMIEIQTYAKGEYVIQQGDYGDTFFIIKNGSVEVIVTDENGEILLNKKMEKGNFFGEMSVLTGEPRTASVVGVTDVELLVLSKSSFDVLLKKYPHIIEHISTKIATRQRQVFEQHEIARSAGSLSDAEDSAQRQVESLSRQLFQKIYNFFSISKI